MRKKAKFAALPRSTVDNTFKKQTGTKTTEKVTTNVGKAKKAAKAIPDTKVAKSQSRSVNGKQTGKACFVAGTLISTEYGLRPIEEIEVGDYVWAENPETKEKKLKKVVHTFIHEKNEIVHLLVKGKEILTTREHPFYVDGKGFVEVEFLHVGDVLRLQSGEKVALEGITYEALESSVYVYNSTFPPA